MNPAIIIPAYNPPPDFPALIQKIRSLYSIPIIIVDDGSDSPVSNDFNYINIDYIVNPVNLGKGASLLRGFKYAFKKGCTHGISIDSDLQHDPVFIEKFLSADEDIALVYGKREFTRSMPTQRRMSNIISSQIISKLCGKKIFDSQCGFRRYLLSELCSNKYIENGFQFESEVIIKFARNGLRFSYIDISTVYNKEVSTIHSILDSIKFIRMIYRCCISG